MRFINKKRVVFLSTVATVLALLIAIWIIMYIKVNSSSVRYQELAMKSAQEIADQEQAKKLVGVIGDSEEYYVSLTDKAVPKEGLVPFIESMERLGSRSGTKVSLSSINVPEDNSTGSTSVEGIRSLNDAVEFSHVTLTVTGVGEWANILKLLKIAENLPYASHIDKVRINKSPAGSTILVDNSSSAAGDAIPLKIGQPKLNQGSASAASRSKPVELWSLQFELTVLKII